MHSHRNADKARAELRSQQVSNVLYVVTFFDLWRLGLDSGQLSIDLFSANCVSPKHSRLLVAFPFPSFRYESTIPMAYAPATPGLLDSLATVSLPIAKPTFSSGRYFEFMYFH